MFRGASKVAIFGVLFAIFFHLYTKLGINFHFHKHHPGDCRQVSGVDFGSEDMEVTQDGLAFITSGVDFPSNSPRFHAFLVEKNVQGRVFLFDFKKPELGARAIKIRPSKNFDPETFQPHGISMIEDRAKGTGNYLLYVVNHVKGGKDRVEKFRFSSASNDLEHIRFFNDSAFHVLNDIAVTGEDQFYASNYLYFDSYFWSRFEHILPLPLGALLYVDAKGVTEVVPKLHGPNGVTLSKDKKFLYAALPLQGTVQVYERQRDNGLKLIQTVPEVQTSVDNFQLTSNGDALLAGAHPIPHKALLHLEDPHFKAPSSVLHLPLSNGRVVTEEISELFYDQGDLISGSSVAHIHSNQLLIGSIIDKLVVCDLYRKPSQACRL